MPGLLGGLSLALAQSQVNRFERASSSGIRSLAELALAKR